MLLRLRYKKTVYLIEQQREDVQLKRAEFIAAVQSLEPERLIFIDETGMHRLYGRAINGQRAKSYAPCHKGQRYTLIGALGMDTIKTGLFGNWYATGELFLTFIQMRLNSVKILYMKHCQRYLPTIRQKNGMLNLLHVFPNLLLLIKLMK